MNPYLASGCFLFLLAFDFVSVGARMAYQLVSQARLIHLREAQEKKANRALLLLPYQTRIRGTFNLALVIVRFCLAGLVLVFVHSIDETNPAWVYLLSLLASGWVVFWIEWTVERTAVHRPEVWAANTAVLAKVLLKGFAWGTALPMALAGEKQEANDLVSSTVTEDDLKTLVDAGEEVGVLEQEERRMIYSIFGLGETLAREIMVPRIDMIALEVNTPPEDAAQVMLDSGHSRVPVYAETVDRTLGVLYVKDLLAMFTSEARPASLEGLTRPAYFIPEAKRLDSLLTEMQAQRIHMAIVVDEYGGVAGLVTMEDIVEEILGEIQDEYDQGEELPFQMLENGDILFQGRVDLDDFNEIMESDLKKDVADTLGGYIYSKLGYVPQAGESVQADHVLLTVEQVSARRIRRVQAHRLTPQEDSERLQPEENEEKRDAN